MPFERARTLLHLGAAQRRAKRKREARATLNEALRVFDALGAKPWSQRASDELARISGRRGGSQLTASERKIAELVADGRTNKEIAAALYLSPKTVEGYLPADVSQARRAVTHRAGAPRAPSARRSGDERPQRRS